MIVITAAVVFVMLKHDWVMDMWRHNPAQVGAVTTAAAASQGVPAQVKEGPDATPVASIKVLPDAAPALAMARTAPELATGATMATMATRKAPAGYLYVLRHVSKVTDSGVVGVDPGTLLALVSRGRVKTQVTDGTADYEIDNEYLTEDTDMADMARRTDAQSQAAVAQLLEQRKAEMEQANREFTEKVETAQQRRAERNLEMAKIAAANRAASSGTDVMQGSSLDRGAYDQHYSRPYWWYYRDRWGYRYYVDAYGHWIYY